MTKRVDLNADMAEGYGPWTMGDDAGLLQVISSANIACGMHAGDWDVMAEVMRGATERGVGVGAHPGFADLRGFGRQRLKMPDDSLRALVAYQVGAAVGMARHVGAELRHLKLHGALGNMTSEDEEMARRCYDAALSAAPDLILMVMAGTAQERAAKVLGARAACEIFADRAYEEDGTLVARGTPGAVIHDPTEAAERILAMMEAGAIVTRSGAHLPARIDTVCLHGDAPGAVDRARTLRARLEAEGVEIQPFEGATV